MMRTKCTLEITPMVRKSSRLKLLLKPLLPCAEDFIFMSGQEGSSRLLMGMWLVFEIEI